MIDFQYRLSNNQKREIAQNLIEFLQNDTNLNKPTIVFIENWILGGSEEKRKAFYDVWDIVLKNYLPATRPVLFRSCGRISKKERIKSFTGRFECARRFSKGKGSIIICDTKEILDFEEEYYKPGEYEHSFYPLVSLLKKARESGGCGLSRRVLDDYIGEDEYIMKVNMEYMYCIKLTNNDSYSTKEISTI